jgi:hypothetical protein
MVTSWPIVTTSRKRKHTYPVVFIRQTWYKLLISQNHHMSGSIEGLVKDEYVLDALKQ